jgi:hypothetical protein
MTKVASSKTAAVVGDDLVLNANQLLGTAAARELPVVAAVAKGSEAKHRIRVVLRGLMLILIAKMRESGFFSPEFLREPPRRGGVDTLPLCCSENSPFEIDAR